MQTAIQKTFLSSPLFAVIGASKDQTKWGTKVLQWYQQRGLPVTPIHPKEAELEGLATVRDIAELPEPTRTSVSVITPPVITLGILQKAKDAGIPALWLQPGVADDAVITFVQENGMEDRVIYGGPCILVQGDGIRSSL
ncbi:NAD-P-binding protein [Vararia minispora EC-137]|uniref:NAD-P-binding protein n=1 Tax=Vararia minispora EC-137 TaxID=1314806 RepID=A0ACB8Q886_9AGAM|nr:NAD-P-binding protein [Vararia minispora EC-137]